MKNQTTTSALIKDKTATREKWLEARLGPGCIVGSVPIA